MQVRHDYTQLGGRPGGRCDMRTFHIITDYIDTEKNIKKQNIFPGEMYSTICVE